LLREGGNKARSEEEFISVENQRDGWKRGQASFLLLPDMQKYF